MSRLAVYTDTDDLDPAAGIELLTKAGFEVIRLETHNEDEIVKAARNAHALLVGYATITKSLIDKLESLEIVSMLSTGTDNIDTQVLKERNIEVRTLGALPAQEVATHTLALTLSMLRGVDKFTAAAQRLEWFKTPYPVIPPRLSELNFGVLGFGRIGELVGTYAAPFFKSVSFHDPVVTKSLDPRFVSRSFDELLATSDVISINIPATAQNKHLFNAAMLSQMKKGSYLVNASRGSLVDSVALAAALKNGHLSGAALDVIDGEPASADNPLLNNPKVLITPHVAYLSQFTQKAYITVQAQNVIDFFNAKAGK
jgi:phosphoglycerate dehydrogenase-like enzyme